MNPKKRPSIYVETTVVSYLTARPDQNVTRLSHEMLTRQWWDSERKRFDLYASELVIREASGGDKSAAAVRLEALREIPLLAITHEVDELSTQLSAALSLPARARADAVHVAIAAKHGMEFLLTWNCRRLANAALADKIDQTCLDYGCVAPRIVTPEQLMERL